MINKNSLSKVKNPNPRAVLFIEATGGGTNADYMSWIQDMAIKYMHQNNLKGISHHGDFTKFVETEVLNDQRANDK